MRLFYEQIIAAASARLELAQVPDQSLSPDLKETAALSQHLLVSSAKAVHMIGWRDTADDGVLRRAVRWHIDHPPASADSDLSADDIALTAT